MSENVAQNIESSQQGNTPINDVYEKAVQDNIDILQQCQRDKGFSTCTMCELLISCEVRNNYVKAVYNSMSKGQHGDFDFN